jgi:DNA-binding transcriptional LysR family regulator
LSGSLADSVSQRSPCGPEAIRRADRSAGRPNALRAEKARRCETYFGGGRNRGVGPLLELRLADLMTLLAVQRTGTISGAARELRVTPSQVSKAVSRLERHYHVRLLSRGARGVAPTPAARRMLPRIANAVEELRATGGAREDVGTEIELSIAGPTYLIAQVLPNLAYLLARARVRSLEMPPAVLRANLSENLFDIAVIPGGIQNLPASWTSDVGGDLRSVLLGHPAFVRRLGALPLTVDRVRSLPFIGPTQTGGDRFVAASDDCPLRPVERTIVHEVHTIAKPCPSYVTATGFCRRREQPPFRPCAKR